MKRTWTPAGKSVAEVAAVARTSTDATILRLILDTITEARVWRSLAGNPELPLDLYAVLAAVPDDRTQEIVASSDRTPARVLGNLSKRSDRLARLVAYNPSTSAARLRILSRHPNATVRAGVAWNWNTPTDVLDALAMDADRRVLLKLMKNGNVTVTGRLALARFSGDAQVCLSLAGNWLTEEEVLSVLASHPDPAVRSKVQWNKNCPDALRRELAGDPVETVRIDVARNWDTPDDVLELLSVDSSDAVRWFVEKNPSAPQATR